MTKRNRRFRVPETVSSREVRGELVVLDLKRGEFFVCKGTGPRVWEFLAEGRSIGEISRLLATRYGVDEIKAEADVEIFVAQLLENGILIDQIT